MKRKTSVDDVVAFGKKMEKKTNPSDIGAILKAIWTNWDHPVIPGDIDAILSSA